MAAPDLHHNALSSQVVAHDFSRSHRVRRHALTLLVIAGALVCSAAFQMEEGRLAGALQHWQGQLTRGLQVSLRAVADGRDQPASTPTNLPSVSTRDLRPR